MRTFFPKIIMLMIISLVVSACGNQRPQIVTGIQVQSSVVNQDVLLSLRADLDLGAMTFPQVTLPIIHPRGQTPIGSVDLLPVLGGKNQIKVTVNVSSLADIRATQATLPNGNSVPLIANNPTITVELGRGAKLYLTLAANAVAIGVAVPISTFDAIGGAVGAINLFPVFTIDRAIGAAGIFTGAPGKNGFALVVDVTQYVNMQDIFVPQQAADMLKMARVNTEPGNIKLNYNSQIPSRSKEDRINSMIYDLNRKKAKLQLRK